ncbi:MAG: polysaccharide deacetylase family protein [Solirubrobacteraceae bacterium]
MLGRELILTFHGLGDGIPPQATDGERKVWVPVEWFEAILNAMPVGDVTLAFDDGNSSDFEHGFQALRRVGRGARFFVLADRIGSPGYLTASQISTMHSEGMTIGSHGVGHLDWRTLSDDALEVELAGSRKMLEETLGAPVLEAACPFGSYDRRVLRGLKAAGYRRVYNSDGGSTRAGAWLAARNTVHRGLDLERWVDLASAGPQSYPSPTLAGKRLVKRLR